MKHAKYAGVVDTRQPIQLIYHRHAFRFIVGTLYEVGDAVNDNQLDAAILVVELIHALYYGVQPFLSGHSRKAERFQFFRLFLLPRTCQQVAYVLEKLYFRLFGIIEQDRLVPVVSGYPYAQRVCFRIGRADTACHDCGYIVALARSLAPGDAEQVALCSQWNIARRYDDLCFDGRVVEVYLA